MPLCVRNTFLHVQDSPLEDDNRPSSDPTTSSSSRSSSVSSAGSPCGSVAKRLPGITRGRARKAYLKFHELSSQSGQDMVLRPSTFAAASNIVEGADTTSKSSERLDSSNDTSVANPRTDWGSADMQLAMYTKVVKQLGDTEANRLVRLSNQRGLSFVELVEKLPMDENLRLLSRGSLDHNAGTCKPCAYFRPHDPRMSCLRGVLCRFCHHEQHTREGFVLRKGKRHRERLKNAMRRDFEWFGPEASPAKAGPNDKSEDSALHSVTTVQVPATGLAPASQGISPPRRQEVVHL